MLLMVREFCELQAEGVGMRRLKFSSFVLASALPFAAPAYGAEPTKVPSTKEAATKESLKLDVEVVALLRRTALALENRSIEPEEQAGFQALITAGDLLREDKTLAPSERERLRALCRARLGQAQEVLKRQTAKETAAKEAPGKRKIAAKNAVISKPATVDAPANQFLAQQLPGGLGFGGAGNTGTANSSVTKASAEELMEIITSSIKPESWEENGGTTGVIRYFSLGHALVIRNTADVHNDLGGLIGQLRK